MKRVRQSKIVRTRSNGKAAGFPNRRSNEPALPWASWEDTQKKGWANVKKTVLIALVLLLGVFLTGTAGYADDYPTQGVENLPQGIVDQLEESRWSGWEITGWVNPDGNLSSSACAFAVVKRGRENVLVAFGWEDGEWVYKWYNPTALPQVEEPVLLNDDWQVQDGFSGPRFSTYYVINNETMEARCKWVQQKDRSWRLVHMSCYVPLMFYDTSVENALRLYNVGWVKGQETDVWVYGTYQTNLRYFSFSAFPRTVKEAREKLSNPPSIPSGTLSAQKVSFSGGQKYEVYQGPGEEYGRAGDGKASVSTNDWIQVFGAENDWMMIQYDISSDRMRIGWIPKEALPSHAQISELQYEPVAVRTTKQTDLTDDPLASQTAVAVLPEGSTVTWLASMGQWAYVECTGTQLLRGFVLQEALEYLE